MFVHCLNDTRKITCVSAVKLKRRKVRQRKEKKMVKKVTKFSDALQKFEEEVEDILVGKAASKGYANDNGGRDFYDAVDLVAGADSHAAGEIVYKVKRFLRKRDKEDLVKIAAWAFLLYDAAERKGE